MMVLRSFKDNDKTTVNHNKTSTLLDLHNPCPSAFLRTPTTQPRLAYAINPVSNLVSQSSLSTVEPEQQTIQI
jgi:hypothetical protein